MAFFLSQIHKGKITMSIFNLSNITNVKVKVKGANSYQDVKPDNETIDHYVMLGDHVIATIVTQGKEFRIPLGAKPERAPRNTVGKFDAKVAGYGIIFAQTYKVLSHEPKRTAIHLNKCNSVLGKDLQAFVSDLVHKGIKRIALITGDNDMVVVSNPSLDKWKVKGMVAPSVPTATIPQAPVIAPTNPTRKIVFFKYSGKNSWAYVKLDTGKEQFTPEFKAELKDKLKPISGSSLYYCESVTLDDGTLFDAGYRVPVNGDKGRPVRLDELCAILNATTDLAQPLPYNAQDVALINKIENAIPEVAPAVVAPVQVAPIVQPDTSKIDALEAKVDNLANMFAQFMQAMTAKA